MGGITEAQPGVRHPESSPRRLQLAVGVALLGVTVAIGAMFLIWISNKYRPESYSGWDLVGASIFQKDNGPHWTVAV